MSERAAMQQKVAAMEATSQNAAEQASHLKAVQENGAQLQATAQKLQQEVQVRDIAQTQLFRSLDIIRKEQGLNSVIESIVLSFNPLPIPSPLQILQGELSKSISNCSRAEAATAQAVEAVRREAEVTMKDAEAQHQAQLRDMQGQLEELAAAAAAKDGSIRVRQRDKGWRFLRFNSIFLSTPSRQ